MNDRSSGVSNVFIVDCTLLNRCPDLSRCMDLRTSIQGQLKKQITEHVQMKILRLPDSSHNLTLSSSCLTRNRHLVCSHVVVIEMESVMSDRDGMPSGENVANTTAH